MLLQRSLIAAFLLVAFAGAMLTTHSVFGQEELAPSENTVPTAEEPSPAAASEVADAAVAEPSVPTDAAPLRIQLIKVRSDWSQGKDPEGTKKALEELLEGVAVSDDFRKDLLGSASRILFPEGYLSVYQPEELAALLAWMKERDLMQTVAESEPIANHERPDWARHYTNGCSARVFATEDMIPMTTLGSDDVPPFTKRTYGVEWIFLSWKGFEKDLTSTKEIAFRLVQAQQRLDRLQGDPDKVVSLDYYGGGGCDGTCSPDRVAVLHGFFNSPAIRQYTREKGWEPLLVIVPAGQKQIEVKRAKLARPVSLQRIGKGNLMPPRTEPAEEENRVNIDEPIVIVYRLQHAGAADLAELLRGLMAGGNVQADVRTNSLVVVATKEQHESLQDLLQNLDAPVVAPQPAAEERDADAVEATRENYRQKDEEARALARSTQGTGGEIDRELRTRLAQLVTQAFDLRQKLQRAEVGLLREKIGIVETRLAQRDTLRKEIIDRRVEELLGGEVAPSKIKMGRISRTEQTKAQQEFDQAQAQCDQAKILLGLYKKVEPSVNKKADEQQSQPQP